MASRFYFLLILLLLLQAEARGDIAPEPSLSLRPSLCLTEKDANDCDIRLELQWTAPGPICIEAKLETPALWCPEEGLTELTINISADRDVEFVLLDKSDSQPLAEARLQVKPVTESSFRRRFRNPWSLF
ncbi:DUF3019 domain-containing protein [Shewanella cyperi]|uniref:DUF3019 domain-containing protein n=1 Tax=Shewanella cyperi TaxID=2814292 RepID=UPI001A94D127|nr:DUF3019 domain-containing protein [Shewanella cyperi]QSX41482.1 DUF3019 domain-containing protein [Shewanella cyperi]